MSARPVHRTQSHCAHGSVRRRPVHTKRIYRYPPSIMTDHAENVVQRKHTFCEALLSGTPETSTLYSRLHLYAFFRFLFLSSECRFYMSFYFKYFSLHAAVAGVDMVNVTFPHESHPFTCNSCLRPIIVFCLSVNSAISCQSHVHFLTNHSPPATCSTSSARLLAVQPRLQNQ